MADLLLREAVDQVRALLRAGSYSDAFALGQHILHFYPKHIETYTALAQVSLATNDLAGANDLLRRVLSADPENIVALSGMGLISEVQDKYDEALWYLERAYEIQPSNDELRSELLRVREMYYGTAPSRVELTSGALARVFARQGQYAQAINEYRRLLKNDSTRYDARVGLAETLYRAGRTDEAAQVAQALMLDAPYALKPNLILGALWTENAVPEGQQFLQRANQLDPEHRVARDLLGERFDGTQAPRLPAPGEGVSQPLPVLAEPDSYDLFGSDSETTRAAQLLSDIERDQEPEAEMEEALFADAETIHRVEVEAREPRVIETPTESIPEATPAQETTYAALFTEPVKPAQETVQESQTANTTFENLFRAEPEKTEPEKPAAPVPADPPPLPPSKPVSKFSERLARGKSGEGLSADTIAAAAAALASSIALDKSNQPAPTRRGHPSIPKVRPVIRSAQEKLPGWLRISATPSNASASFDIPASSAGTTVAPKPTTESDRPDWLVQAEAVSVQENIPAPKDAALPDWLKPASASESTQSPVEAPRPVETPSWLRDSSPVETPRTVSPVETPKPAEMPSWLRDTSPVESAQAAPAPVEPAAPKPSVPALPDWLRDAEPQTPAFPSQTLSPTAEAQGWTNAPTESAPAEPIRRKTLEQEPPIVSASQTAETNAGAETPVAAVPVQKAAPEPQKGAAPEPLTQAPTAQVEQIRETPQNVQQPVAPVEPEPERTQVARLSNVEPVAHAEPEPSPEPAEAAEPAPPVVEERSTTQAMPDSATMLQMARDKRASGDLKGALDLYERVMHRRPNYLDQITTDLQEIIKTGGAPTSANRLLGEAYAMVGRFKESLEQYRIAMGK